MHQRIIEATLKVLRLIGQGAYTDVEKETKGIRLSAEDIRLAIQSYGQTLVPPPVDAPNSFDIIQINGRIPIAWSIRCPIWTKEEGKSDLSIELTVIDDENQPIIELDNLHVL